MPRKRTRQLAPACPDCANDTFTLRVLKDEGLGAVQCLGCQRHYLLLDSEDHWFDAIQQHYPRLSQCACKSTSFRLRIDYAHRDDGDIEWVAVSGECANCSVVKRRMSADIDYSPTSDLEERPLRACANPKLIYDLREYSLVVDPAAMAEVVRHLRDQEGCRFVGTMRVGGEWVVQSLDGDAAVQAVLADVRRDLNYQWIYAMPGSLAVPASEVEDARREDAFARRNEVIRLAAPIRYYHGGQMYFLRIANQFVDEGDVRTKPATFLALTDRLERWLAERFVNWRGNRNFDDPQENVRMFGDRFAKGRWPLPGETPEA